MFGENAVRRRAAPISSAMEWKMFLKISSSMGSRLFTMPFHHGDTEARKRISGLAIEIADRTNWRKLKSRESESCIPQSLRAPWEETVCEKSDKQRIASSTRYFS